MQQQQKYHFETEKNLFLSSFALLLSVHKFSWQKKERRCDQEMCKNVGQLVCLVIKQALTEPVELAKKYSHIHYTQVNALLHLQVHQLPH